MTVLSPLFLAGCHAPLRCTSASVVERVNVKLDREMNESIVFPEPHEPSRSSFTVDAIAANGASDGELMCIARFRATLSTSAAFAAAHDIPPANAHTLDRRVRFTAHADGWDTFVEIVGLDPLAAEAPGPAPSGPTQR